MKNKRGEHRKKILINIYSSSFVYSMLAMLVIVAMEIFMLAYTVINPGLYGEFIGLYRAFYIALLLAAILYLALNQWLKGDIEHRYAWLYAANPLYGLFFFAWALGITHSDAGITGTIDTSVFMSFSFMLPLCFYVPPHIYGLIAAVADAVMLYIIVAASGGLGQLINLVIFIIFQLVFGLSALVLKTQLAERIIQEQENAHKDVMTGFGNRRAYERELESLAKAAVRQNLTYITIDINGLKEVNDRDGHDAGDRLIVGAAQCVEQCFAEKGRLFRTGGDEFVVLTAAEDLEKRLAACQNRMRSWSEHNQLELSASYGHASYADHPGSSIVELAKAADDEMYRAKALYYAQTGKERRRPRGAE